MKSTQSDFFLKIKLILPATAATLLAVTAGYALLRWICLVSGLDAVKEEAWEFYIPMLLSGVFVFGVLGSRIRIIKDNTTSHSRVDARSIVYLIVWAMGFVMLTTAQGIVTYKCATTTHLESVGNGTDLPQSRYYRIDNTVVNPVARGGYVESRRISHRYNSGLRFHFYVVYPFEGQRNVWYGIHFSEEYKNKQASDEEVQNAYSSFIAACSQKPGATFPTPSQMLERVLPSNDRDGYVEAVRNAENGSMREELENIVILKEATTVAEQRWVSNANALMLAFPIGIALLTFVLLFMPLDRKRITPAGTLKAAKQGTVFFTILPLKAPGNWPLAGILAILIGLFAAMTIAGVDPLSPATRELMKWGAANHDGVFGGAWWLLLSAVFVHSGVMHLIGNLGALILCLPFAIGLFRGDKTALIFIITGICGTLAAVIPPDTAVVGASGAIMGVYGAVITAILLSKEKRKDIGNIIWILIGVVVLTLVIGMSMGISNSSHIAGLVSGGILGLLLATSERRQSPRSGTKSTKKRAPDNATPQDTQ